MTRKEAASAFLQMEENAPQFPKKTLLVKHVLEDAHHAF